MKDSVRPAPGRLESSSDRGHMECVVMVPFPSTMRGSTDTGERSGPEWFMKREPILVPLQYRYEYSRTVQCEIVPRDDAIRQTFRFQGPHGQTHTLRITRFVMRRFERRGGP